MLVAIMSDLHDNTVAWEFISKYLVKHKISRLINCGDTCAPAMLATMSATYPGHIDTVFGNVADRDLEMSVVKKLSNVTHHGDAGAVTIENKKIFFNHFPGTAEQQAKNHQADLACHGHTHLKRWKKIDQTYILNPGTAGGMFQYPSFALVNLETMSCSFVEVMMSYNAPT